MAGSKIPQILFLSSMDLRCSFFRTRKPVGKPLSILDILDIFKNIFGCWILDIAWWILHTHIGYWIWEVDSWIFDVAYWILYIGYWMLDIAFQMLDVGYWMWDVGCGMLDISYCMLDIGY